MSQRILCIDDDPDFLISLKMQMGKDCEVKTAGSLVDGLELLRSESLDLVFLDVGLGDESGIEGIKRIKDAHPDIDIVMLTGDRDPRVVVEAIRAGATDYITKPFEAEELVAVIEAAAKTRQVREKYEALVEAQNTSDSRRGMVYSSRRMRDLISQAEQLKGHQANVLINGETGTGKELLARHIHRVEGNPQRPFIAVNCAAIPDNLMESELFGAERGAYTGALSRRIGRFELADGGDIFFDEIGALKLDLQSKILRVLQEKEFTRVGGSATIHANFRVIAATNDELERKVTRGEFRMDLYHRLRVIQLTIPPLRERSEDIPLLVERFLKKHAPCMVTKRLAPEAIDRLMAYHWPGNVRELENVVQSLMILAPGDVVEAGHLPAWALNGIAGPESKPHLATLPSAIETVGTLKEYAQKAERHYIEHVLRTTGGDKSRAARVLDVGRTTLYSKLKEFGLM